MAESTAYIPGFLSEAEARSLWDNIAASRGWKEVSHRRLLQLGGIPSERGMVAAPLPRWLEPVLAKVAALGIYADDYEPGVFVRSGPAPNHVLVNEYEPPESGIMAHRDGPLYAPAVAIVSLGSSATMDFYRHEAPTAPPADAVHNPWGPGRPEFSVFLEPRSLLVFSHAAYEQYLHGIAGRSSDEVGGDLVNAGQLETPIGATVERTTRISLTIRVVQKVRKGLLRL